MNTLYINLDNVSLTMAHGIVVTDNRGVKIGFADITDGVIIIRLDDPKREEAFAEQAQTGRK